MLSNSKGFLPLKIFQDAVQLERTHAVPSELPALRCRWDSEETKAGNVLCRVQCRRKVSCSERLRNLAEFFKYLAVY